MCNFKEVCIYFDYVEYLTFFKVNKIIITLPSVFWSGINSNN